jgi:hypothetical protein
VTGGLLTGCGVLNALIQTGQALRNSARKEGVWTINGKTLIGQA